MTTFSDASGSDLFHDSQFESLASDNEDDQRRALYRTYQDATRWIIQAYTAGMQVSPDGAFKQDSYPLHQPLDPNDELQQRTTLDTRIVGHRWMQQAQSAGGVIVIDLFGGMGAMLEAVLRAGLQVRNYYYCDSDLVATKVMKRRLLELALRFPTQVVVGAMDDTFAYLPQDMKSISRTHLTAITQTAVDNKAVIFLAAGFPCQDLSSAGGAPKGLKGQRSGLFYPTVDLLIELQTAADAATGGDACVGYMLENVAMQHGHKNIEQMQEDFKSINAVLGMPT